MKKAIKEFFVGMAQFLFIGFMAFLVCYVMWGTACSIANADLSMFWLPNMDEFSRAILAACVLLAWIAMSREFYKKLNG